MHTLGAQVGRQGEGEERRRQEQSEDSHAQHTHSKWTSTSLGMMQVFNKPFVDESTNRQTKYE